MKAKYHLIGCVGTSFINGRIRKEENKGKECIEERIKKLAEKFQEELPSWPDKDKLGEFPKDLEDIQDLFTVEEKSVFQIKGIEYEEYFNKPQPTAEIQSILSYMKKICTENDGKRGEFKVTLLPSDNPESYITAVITMFWIRAGDLQGWFKNLESFVDFDVKPLHIDVNNEDSFIRSVENLFGKLDELRMQSEKSNEKVIINMTGGYKAVSAFELLYAQIHGLPAIYSHENNPQSYELMSLPVNFAISAIDEEYSMLSWKAAAEGQSPPLKAAPEWVQKMPSPLAKKLVTFYRDNRRSLSGRGEALLSRLKERYYEDNDPYAQKISEYLQERINTDWAELWLGDQIPETVEHSRRHSKRLMEAAGNLLRCSSKVEDRLAEWGVLKPGKITLLVSTIFLHDIGHTAIAFPAVPAGEFPLNLFPSAVREVHNLLSGDMIEENEKTLFPESRHLSEGDPPLRQMRTLVPLISRYHRQHLPLVSGAEADKKPRIDKVGEFLYGKEEYGKWLKPLECHLRECRERVDLGADLKPFLRIAALMRVLDSLDVQADRVVDDIYLKARLARTRAEANACEHQLQFLKDACPGEIFNLTKEICEIGRARPENSEATKNGLDKKLAVSCKELYEKVFENLIQMKEEAGSLGAIAQKQASRLLALSLANRAAFKWEQFLHFDKHRKVGFVLPTGENGKTVIRLFPNPEAGAKREDLEPVRKDIEEEIKATGELLDDLNLEVKTETGE
jgi:hypothetical protein